MEIGTLKLNSFMSGNRLPTTHQHHAAAPPLTDLLAALRWMHSGVNWSSYALTCTDCTNTQGQSAMLCFAACGKLSTQARTCADCKPLAPSDMTVMENWMLANLAAAGGWRWLLSNLLDTSQGAVLAGTESSVPDSFPPLAIASLRAVCQWCCTPLRENLM